MITCLFDGNDLLRHVPAHLNGWLFLQYHDVACLEETIEGITCEGLEACWIVHHCTRQ
jgi:hypothetical protein